MSELKIPREFIPASAFTCGPSQGHPRVRATALKETMFERSHRSADITKSGLIKETALNLRKLLEIPEDYVIIQFGGGATAAMDAAAWNLASDSISGYRFGSFSKLWGKNIAGMLPESVKQSFADIKDEEVFPSASLDLNASLIILTPNETSTGVMIPDKILENVWEKKSQNSLVAWDCTSCAGGRKLPGGKYDVMIFSYQKCFGVGGGSALMVLSPRAVERSKEVQKTRKIPYFLHLEETIMRAVEKHQTLNTPSNTNIWMANEAAKWMLENGGLDAMDSLVKSHAQILFKWVDRTGWLDYYVKDTEFRSNLTPTFKVDESVIDAAEISKALASTGISCLKDGIKKYGSMKGNLIRIACFPFVDAEGTGEFEKLTKAVDYIVEQLGNVR
ncbi:MAG: aminotransferase class V-fold PLP-dependent enzyme [bacterium]